MIDLHCHALPGVDDGPGTIEDALALARAAARQGVKTVVATPHVSSRYPNTSSTIGSKVASLNRCLSKEHVQIEVRQGAEVAASHVAEIDVEELAKLTLGSGPWLLLEPPFAPSAAGLDALVFGLMRAGHRIVIAHPERCPAFYRDPSLLNTLVVSGALTSITAGSLAGRFGKRARSFASRMFAEGIVHNVASDAHDERGRPPGMTQQIVDAGYEGLREWLTESVPAAILSGEQIPRRPSAPIGRPRRGLFASLRRGR